MPIRPQLMPRYSLACWRKPAPRRNFGKLLLARADAGKLIAGSEEINLSDLIEEIAEDISIWRRPGAPLRSQVDPDILVTGDRPLLQQLLQSFRQRCEL